MGRKVDFSARLSPSLMMKTHMKHQGDVSEGSQANLLAVREICGRRVELYTSGEHLVDAHITPEEMYDSEILRFAHASVIIEGPVGHKRTCYVDASSDTPVDRYKTRSQPCEVWCYGHELSDFIEASRRAIGVGTIATELIVDGDPTPELRRQLHV